MPRWSPRGRLRNERRRAIPWGEPAINRVRGARAASEIVSTLESVPMRWLALVLLIGCGDNLAGITLDQRQAAETAARCEQLTRCGLAADVATCIAATR